MNKASTTEYPIPNTQIVFAKWGAVGSGSSFNNSGLIIPEPSVTIPKPWTYEFRVAEFVNDSDEIVKVGLQVCISEHDVYGVRNVIQDWTDVERVKIKV